jgi:hypothetical protein
MSIKRSKSIGYNTRILVPELTVVKNEEHLYQLKNKVNYPAVCKIIQKMFCTKLIRGSYC